MSHHYVLSLKPTVVLEEHGDDLSLADHRGHAVRMTKPGKALRFMLTRLAAGGMTADQLCAATSREDESANLALLYYAIRTLERNGFVLYTLAIGGNSLATLEPISPGFRMEEASGDLKYGLSRFACLRRMDDHTLVESPVGHARLSLHDGRAAAIFSLLAVPHTAAELAAELPELAAAVIPLLSLLRSAGAAFPCTADGRVAEDESEPLRQWEFHDLLFHSRSRSGRHEYPLGGTFRFRDTLPSLPAVKPPMSARRFALHKPEMAALEAGDMPFSRVSESRQSIHGRGEQPISAIQLGEFLYRSARVKSITPAEPAQGAPYESSRRVCPSGGAMHELELYLTISRCDGIAPGLYHYDPLGHTLEHLADPDAAQQALLADGIGAAGLSAPPDVLITFAARFQRVSWKYQSMAYAVILKNVGVLYQQMYLVATAMTLAPCALGGGNSDRFAEAAGLDYYAETSVGEFVLSSHSVD
jgi:oxazoline/thiazoline dehydrogenase